MGLLDLGLGIGSAGILPGIQAGAGLVQSILGGIKANKAQKQLEGLQTPTYGGSKPLSSYYNTALQRYNVNPYQSQQYQYSNQQADRSQAAGIGSLQDRRSAVGGISRLAALRNDAGLRSGIAAENEQNQRFGQLGAAAGMKTQDELRQFQYNQVAPYEKKYNLLAMKAGGANQMANAGFQNIFGGLSSASMIGTDAYLNPQNTNQGNYNQGGYGNNIPNTYSDYLSRNSYFKR